MLNNFKRTPAERKKARGIKKQWGVSDIAINAVLALERENEKFLSRIKQDHPNWFNSDGTMKPQDEVHRIIVLEEDPSRLSPKDLSLRAKLLESKKVK